MLAVSVTSEGVIGGISGVLKMQTAVLWHILLIFPGNGDLAMVKSSCTCACHERDMRDLFTAHLD